METLACVAVNLRKKCVHGEVAVGCTLIGYVNHHGLRPVLIGRACHVFFCVSLLDSSCAGLLWLFSSVDYV